MPLSGDHEVGDPDFVAWANLVDTTIGAVQASVTTEATARAAADSSEATTRSNADTTEATARAAADTTLQTNITAEATARAAADAAHEADTTNIHGIADTSVLLTQAAAAGAYVAKSGDTMSGDLAMGTHKITGLLDPTSAQDAATRAYVLAVRDALINSAPGALDTLGELAAALQADESAAATLTTLVGTKGIKLTPTAKTTTYTAVDGDLVLASTAGGAFTVTLPASTAGRIVAVKKTDSGSNAVTIATTSGTIDGAATRSLSKQYQSQTYIADGTNWHRITMPGVEAIAASGTADSTSYLRGDGAWAAPASSAYQVGMNDGTGYAGWLVPGHVASSLSTDTTTINRLNFTPIVLQRTWNLTGIALNVTVAGSAGALTRMGIYNADSKGMPTTLVLDAGTVATDSTGVKSITIAQALPAGYYALARISNIQATIRSWYTRGPLASARSGGFDQFPTALDAALTYAALPGTAPTPAFSSGFGEMPTNGVFVRE